MALETARKVVLRTLLRFGVIPLAVSAVFWISPASADAQIRDIEPFYIEITSENVYLRCGDGESWYPVGRLDAGTVLLVDGEGYGWLRVSYPAGLGGLVRADEGELTANGTVTLTKMSALRAFNHNGGVVHSWKKLLGRPAPSGSTLTYLRTLNDDDGKIAGYIVEAPIQARGYISEGFTRRIDGTDARARLGSSVPANVQGRETQSLAQDTAPAVNSAVTPLGGSDRVANSDQTAPDAVLANEAISPAQDTIAASQATSPGEPIVLTMGNGPAIGSQTQASLEALKTAFERVIAQPIEEAEFTSLIEEHERLLDEVQRNPQEESVVDFLQSRIELLRIRVDLQESMVRMAMLESRAREEAGSVDEQIAQWRARPEYVVVGRLSTSAVYDGTRMPLLYRIQSIDGSVGRTLAYIAPDENLDLRSKLGTIVGVVGQRSSGGTTRAATITATRIDILGE